MAFFKEKMELEIEEAELRTENFLSHIPPFYRWFFGIWILLIIPGYSIIKSASFKYWQNNLKGYEVYAKPSFTEAKNPTIGDIILTTNGDKSYAAAVQIENPNVDLAVNDATIQFNFYNQKNEIIKTVTDTFFLLPNDKKFLIVPKITSSENIVKATVRFPEKFNWQKMLNIPKVQLITSQANSYNQTDPVAFVVEGSVKNNSPYSLSRVRLKFLLYNNSGQLLASTQRDEFTLAPFEQRSYKQLWPNIVSTNVTKTDVFAETNTLDETNLQLKTDASHPSSDLSRPDVNQ